MRGKRQAIPEEVFDWVRGVFLEVNRKVTGTLSRVPSHHEDALDQALVSSLNEVPSVGSHSGWGVYIQTHFLGGRRHFYNWEIADIGIIAILRDRTAVQRIKVGLLQSKRLYPTEDKTLKDPTERYLTGFGGLLLETESFRKMAEGRAFSFRENSKYLAMDLQGEQAKRLEKYQTESRVPIYYLFYNPVVLPWTVKVPTLELPPMPELDVGCRIVPEARVREGLSAGKHSPTFKDIASLSGFKTRHRGGWSLEHFVADELLRCREGYLATDVQDRTLFRLFNERSGPIAAAVAITIEAPDGVVLELPEPKG